LQIEKRWKGSVNMIKSLMMDDSLMISGILRHAESVYPGQEIVTRTVAGEIHRYTYQQLAGRARQLANALLAAGINTGDTVTTIAWNTHRHLEAYYAVSGIGAVLHTLNPRLHPDQVAFILGEVKPKIVLIDTTFLLLIAANPETFKSVEKIIVLEAQQDLPELPAPPFLEFLAYEEWIADCSNQYEWPVFDELTAAAMCYTSGTTGNPKGVVYSHRSTVLHAMALGSANGPGVRENSCVLPIVPMFHVCAWGVPYGALMAGSKLVLPGAGMDGKSLAELLVSEEVTLTLGVPTVLQGVIDYCRNESIKLPKLKTLVNGGSAASSKLIHDTDEVLGAFLMHAWGMTETSPLGLANSLTNAELKLAKEDQYSVQLKQGLPPFGIELQIWDENGNVLIGNPVERGRLMVRGPWVAGSYFGISDSPSWVDGWFDTGDIAIRDENGRYHLVDRAKDIIKSGGEWISSIDIENIASSSPLIATCAVIGVAHPKWVERPLMVVVPADEHCTESKIKEYLQDKIAKWWMPDKIVFVESLPLTATAKVSKLTLRNQYSDAYQS
jgi:acyl-CoA synthetase (AMP-forming)/AMP-acid ligase II